MVFRKQTLYGFQTSIPLYKDIERDTFLEPFFRKISGNIFHFFGNIFPKFGNLCYHFMEIKFPKGFDMIKAIETKKKGKLFSKQQTLDPNTGELHEILLIGNPEEFDRNFTKVFHAFTEALIGDEEIAGKAIRLLFWIIKELEYGSIEFYMHAPSVAKELNVTERTIRIWRKTLEKKGIIRKIKPNLYQLNPACVVKGKGHTLLEEFKTQS